MLRGSQLGIDDQIAVLEAAKELLETENGQNERSGGEVILLPAARVGR